MSNVITYEKFYTDDTGKHIEDIFGDTGINVKSLWGNSIDAFSSYNIACSITCLCGDVRIIFANEESNNNFKFNQYYISGLDGKIINIPEGTWFGINNLNSEKAIILSYYDECDKINIKRMSPKIFNWYLKK